MKKESRRWLNLGALLTSIVLLLNGGILALAEDGSFSGEIVAGDLKIWRVPSFEFDDLTIGMEGKELAGKQVVPLDSEKVAEADNGNLYVADWRDVKQHVWEVTASASDMKSSLDSNDTLPIKSLKLSIDSGPGINGCSEVNIYTGAAAVVASSSTTISNFFQAGESRAVMKVDNTFAVKESSYSGAIIYSLVPKTM
jgi:hypothetical protein